MEQNCYNARYRLVGRLKRKTPAPDMDMCGQSLKEVEMEHRLPDLPFDKSALAPNISAETLEYHYGKHHKTYVDNLNKLIPGTEFEKLSLEDIIK